mgnify:CR=1 FL=1
MLRPLNAYDEIVHLMVSSIDPERLIAYDIPVYLIDRYQILVEKEKAEAITIEEKSELDSLLMINHVISLAKLMAIKKLAAA